MARKLRRSPPAPAALPRPPAPHGCQARRTPPAGRRRWRLRGRPRNSRRMRCRRKDLRALQRARRAAGLHRQRVRPFAGEQAHRLHEAGARRQHFVRRAARGGAETLGHAVVPAPTFVLGAGEVGHEEKVEMRQVVGQVFRRQGQVGRQATVGRRRDAGRIGQGQRGGGRLRHRADAADARHQHQGIGRQLALQDLFEAAVQRRIDIGRDDRPASMSSVTSRSPSTRLKGPTTRRVVISSPA
jgi:hypothetical protein